MMYRGRTAPLQDQVEPKGQENWTQKDPDQAKREDPAKGAQEHENEWQASGTADQIGLEQIVHTTDNEHAPDRQKHSGRNALLHAQPDRNGTQTKGGPIGSKDMKNVRNPRNKAPWTWTMMNPIMASAPWARAVPRMPYTTPLMVAPATPSSAKPWRRPISQGCAGADER
jgi:hypothetical protein